MSLKIIKQGGPKSLCASHATNQVWDQIPLHLSNWDVCHFSIQTCYQDQLPLKASPEINLILLGPALRFKIPKQNWGQGGIQAMALRGTSKNRSGRTHKHYFNPKQQMPSCNVAWQTWSSNISGRLGFYQSHSHGTDPKQYLSLGPLSLQILSLNDCDFYKKELSSNLSHFWTHHFSLHWILYSSISPSTGMPEAQQVQRNVAAASFRTVMMTRWETALAVSPWNKLQFCLSWQKLTMTVRDWQEVKGIMQLFRDFPPVLKDLIYDICHPCSKTASSALTGWMFSLPQSKTYLDVLKHIQAVPVTTKQFPCTDHRKRWTTKQGSSIVLIVNRVPLCSYLYQTAPTIYPL